MVDRHRAACRITAIALIATLTASCNTRALPKSLFITPKRFANAHKLSGKSYRVVKHLDVVLRIGRLHLEGPYNINFSTEFQVNQRIDRELGLANADFITDVEMTYMDFVLPRGLTLAIPIKVGSGGFLNGWIGIPIFGIYPHMAVIHVTGDLIAIDDEQPKKKN